MEPSASTTPRRKFAPVLIESTTRTSSPATQKQGNNQQPSKVVGQSSQKPTPTPTAAAASATSADRVSQGNMDNGATDRGKSASRSSSQSSRKFAPQLIETGKRSFRQNPPTTPNSSTKRQLRPKKKDIDSKSASLESRFSHASLVRRQNSEGTRRHSFRVPGLPIIPSNSSEGSTGSPTSSLSTSPTAFSNEFTEQQKSQQHQPNNDHDNNTNNNNNDFPETFEQQMVAAEKMLQDRALAAFPNEQIHQTVSHFAIDREDESTEEEDVFAYRQFSVDLSQFRRESTVDLAWQMEEMRRHKEESEMRARENIFAANQSNFSAAAIAARQMIGEMDEWNKEEKRAISPPMLGDDIVFPICLSPQSTRCDTDQFPTVPHEDVKEAAGENDVGLWTANLDAGNNGEGGLWNGTCHRTSQADEKPSKILDAEMDDVQVVYAQPDIIHTPAPEHGSPVKMEGLVNAAPSHSDAEEAPPVDEQDIEEEFHDGFVSQIYNYLSLGYPCLARDFDEELSKVTLIPIAELRKDDLNTDAKGYVRSPENFRASDKAPTPDGKCVRWNALKLYIHEWGRQLPGRSRPYSNLDTWGFRGRRGSWAV